MDKPDNDEKDIITVNPLRFEPRELDLTFLRELPEINIAAITAIPKEVLDRGRRE